LEKASGRPATPETTPTHRSVPAVAPTRPAWIEINLARLRHNFRRICQDKPPHLSIMAIVKDEAYGHGSIPVAQTALQSGASFLGASTLHEALALRSAGIAAPILLLGERTPDELPCLLEHSLGCCVNHFETAATLNQLARSRGSLAPIHLKVDTGMCRYGVRWTDAPELAARIQQLDSVRLEGVMSHFSMSDETDKSYAHLQLTRFKQTLAHMESRGIRPRWRHLCNSGGFLDLPEAHYDLVRLGILPLGVYPSQVCRRIPGIQPVMTLKSRIASLQTLHPGESAGYGMRYTATSKRRIGVIPLGYGDGFPRLRNAGHVLVHGHQAPIIGANAMDATIIDLTGLPNTRLWDEVVLLGRQGQQELSIHDIARWGNTVSYHRLCGWRSRLPRVYTDGQP